MCNLILAAVIISIPALFYAFISFLIYLAKRQKERLED